MSSVMAYFIFWMMFIHKQECAAIRLDHRNRDTLEYIIQKYMNPLRRLSADLPNHAIELDIEIHGSVPREVKKNPRRFIRLINPHHPKPIPRAQDEKAVPEAPAAVDLAVNKTVTPEVGQAAIEPAVPPGVPESAAPQVVPPAAGTDPEIQKIPVFMEDLKKALEELEKKLMTKPENSATVTATNRTDAAVVPQSPNAPLAAPQPVRSIDEIVQLLKKAIHVEHRMPKAGDEKLEWVQIKIPKSVQL